MLVDSVTEKSQKVLARISVYVHFVHKFPVFLRKMIVCTKWESAFQQITIFGQQFLLIDFNGGVAVKAIRIGYGIRFPAMATLATSIPTKQI